MTDQQKLEELQKQRPIMVTEQELRLLHWCVERHAPREAFPLPEDDLALKDLEARLAAAVVLPVDVQDVALQLVPEHLRDAVRSILQCGDEHVAVAVWCEEDVFYVAKGKGMEISREQAQEVLAKMGSAELGITWATIDSYLGGLETEEGGEDDRTKNKKM